MRLSLRQRFVFLSLLVLVPASAEAAYDRMIPKDYVSKLISSSPEAYFQEINSGWRAEQYASLKKKLSPGRSYLVLHNRLPSTPLDLRTPNGFRSSVMNLGLLNMSTLDIGHVMIGWHCEIDGKTFEGNTAITGEQDNQQRAMATGGWGLTGLFSLFKDGHLQTPTLVGSVFRLAREGKPIATLAFEVEAGQCQQMLTYLQTFLAHENKPFKRFGLNADPLKFEGGGCGSFGAAALSTAGGVFDDFFPHLWRNLKANNGVFGYGLPNLPSEIEPFNVPRTRGASYKIGAVSTLMLKNWNPTSQANTVSMRLIDPEMLFLAQQTVMRASLDDVYRDSLAMGRALLASQFVKPRILKEQGKGFPEESRGVDFDETRIDARFDANAAGVVEGVKRWYRGMKNKGYRSKGFEFNGLPAVLLTR